MKIVKFDDGKYALRKFSFSEMRYLYKDLEGGGMSGWRETDDRWFKDCLADSEEEVRRKAGLRKVVEVLDV